MTRKMKILIGYDGSDCAEAALDDLQRAGLPAAAEALVLSVTEAWLPPPPPSTWEIVEQAREVRVPADMRRVYAQGSDAIEEGQSLAERTAVRLRGIFPRWQISVAALVGSPSRELIMKADEWQPDLIAVGSHGRSTFGRLVLGSVSQGVLTHAHCSVRIARGRVEEPDTPVRIVIGVDGSPASAAAVIEVGSRSWPPLSEVSVIAVYDPLTPTLIGRFIPPVAGTIKESNQADRDWLEQVLKDAAMKLTQPGVKVLTGIREGNPKRVLVEAAREWSADCIFVGSIGSGSPFERFVLGSVSASVAAHAHCSVEVVRPSKTSGGNNHERQSEVSGN